MSSAIADSQPTSLSSSSSILPSAPIISTSISKRKVTEATTSIENEPPRTIRRISVLGTQVQKKPASKTNHVFQYQTAKVPRAFSGPYPAWMPSSYETSRHGPSSTRLLSEKIDEVVHEGESHKRESRNATDPGGWTLELVGRQGQKPICNGCQIAIERTLPRLSWKLGWGDQPYGLRHMPGYYDGSYHLVCGTILSKLASGQNLLTEIRPGSRIIVDHASYGDVPEDDVKLLAILSRQTFVFLKASLQI